jgi:hypothetical protein
MAAVALGTIAAACNSAAKVSSATQPTAPASSAKATSATGGASPLSTQGFEFKGTIAITGAATVNSTFTQLHPAVAGGDVSAEQAQQTCAKAAVVGDANFGIGVSGDTWQVPTNSSDISAPANVNVTLHTGRWQGPGTYSVDALSVTSGVRINNSTYYDLTNASAAQLTVNPDGSGSLTFQNAPVTGQSTPTISGAVSWTCTNHS